MCGKSCVLFCVGGSIADESGALNNVSGLHFVSFNSFCFPYVINAGTTKQIQNK